ncbi:YfhO family protein [Spirillospora sp. NPDC047279]|uniref:YfhO family protein n=1 Tax=Spirillospora sp. NPDC047279 TaxID=3155478 RepID=UPI0033D386E3
MRHEAKAAAALAASATLAVFTLAGVLRGTVPFGAASRGTDDLGRQFGPMHAHLADLVRGRGHGDLFFNWNSGMGVPFLGDYQVYLASPLAPLVALFPDDRLDLALFVLTAVKMAAAAVAMTVYLRTLGRGHWWLLALFGAAYGLSGWAVDDAAYVPQWLDSLIFLPLMCLAGEWVLQRRRPVLCVLVFALAWQANFYTGYMATLGASAIFLARLLTLDPRPRPKALAALCVRYALVVGCAVALVAPLLYPTFLAARNAPATTGHAFDASPLVFLARLLPASEGAGTSPSLYVSTAVLLAVLVFPLHRAVPRRSRIVWSLLLVLVALSYQQPGQYVWNGFDSPDGSPYRPAFTLCAALVVVGWTSVVHGPPGREATLAALAVLSLLCLLAVVSPISSPHAPLLLLVSALAAGAVVLAVIRRGPRPAVVVACLLLAGVTVAEETATAVFVDERRSGRFSLTPAWGPEHDARVRAIRAADAFPAHRTGPGTPAISANDPMLLRGQGAGYYSSVLPVGTSRTLIGLGFPYDLWGRWIKPSDNPVLDAVFAVRGAPGRSSPGRAAPPLVTVHPAPAAPAPGASPFQVQEAVLGSKVYVHPEVRWTRTGERDEAEVTCPAGGTVAAWTPKPPAGDYRDRSGPGLVAYGTVPASGTLKITRAAGPAPLVGCVDPARLSAAIVRLRAQGATRVVARGHSVEADLPPGGQGVAVVSVPLVEGWRCAAGDGRSRPPVSHGGLVAVPVDASTGRIRCSYEPPGLRPGLLAGGLGLLATLVLGVTASGRHRRISVLRRTPTSDRPGSSGP